MLKGLTFSLAFVVFAAMMAVADVFGFITWWYAVIAGLVSFPLGFALLLGVAHVGIWSEDRARARRRAKAKVRKLSEG